MSQPPGPCPWRYRLLFLFLALPFAALGGAGLALGAWMASEGAWYAAAVFLCLGVLPTAYFLGLSWFVVIQGRL